MNTTRRVVAVAGIVILLSATLGIGYLYGVGPLEEDVTGDLDEPEDRGEVVEVDDEGDDGGDEEAGEDGEEAEDRPAFELEILDITECGETCRDVAVSLHNNRDVEATEVVVYTRIYSGASTAEEDVVWADNRDVGAIAAGATVEHTDRIELSPQQANNVRQEDGLITIETTVESQQETVTFVREENVM